MLLLRTSFAQLYMQLVYIQRYVSLGAVLLFLFQGRTIAGSTVASITEYSVAGAHNRAVSALAFQQSCHPSKDTL